MTVWDHLLAFACGVGLPVFGLLQHRAARADGPVVFTRRDKVVTYWASSVQLAVVGGLTLLVWRAGGRTLDELGLTARPEDLGTGLLLAAAFLVAYAADVLHKVRPSRRAETRARWRRDTPFMPATWPEVGHSLVLVVAAALFEELVYRGFLVAYVAHFTGTTPLGLALAVALPAAVFGVLHLYQGARSAVLIALLAGVFGALLVVTGSLWIPIALHLLVDLIGSLLGPWLMAERPPEAPLTGP